MAVLRVVDILELDVLRGPGMHVVAGHTGLEKPVRWVHISELPYIAELLKGGELLLTTGVALPDDGHVQFINDLADISVSGVVFQLGPRFSALPQPMRSAADRRGLPLVTLSSPTRFVDVTEAAHAWLLGHDTTELRESLEASRRFTRQILNGADASDIVGLVAELTGRPVVLEGPGHRVLTYGLAGVSGDAEMTLRNWQMRSKLFPYEHKLTTHETPERWMLCPVVSRGEPVGRLVMICAAPPSHRDEVVLEEAAVSLALLESLRPRAETSQRRAHHSLALQLLTHHPPLPADVLTHADLLGAPLRGRQLVAARVRASLGVRGDYSREADAAIRHLSSSAAGAGLGVLATPIGASDIAAVLTVDDGQDANVRLGHFARALRAALSEVEGLPTVHIAVGRVVSDVNELHHSYWEATQVIEAVGQHSVPQEYVRFKDIQIDGLLRLLKDDARVQAFAESHLGDLIAYDRKYRSELVETLRSFLEAGGSKLIAAEVLGISRGTLYQRLERISEVIGDDLEAVATRLSLHLALITRSLE